MSQQEAMTGEQICELVVYALGLPKTPQEVWEWSPSGELWHIPVLMHHAEVILTKRGVGPRAYISSPIDSGERNGS